MILSLEPVTLGASQWLPTCTAQSRMKPERVSSLRMSYLRGRG